MNITINGRPVGYSLKCPRMRRDGQLISGLINDDGNAIIDVHGRNMGSARMVGEWEERDGRLMRHYELVVDGITYSGRCAGPGRGIFARRLKHPNHSKYVRVAN